MRKKTYHAPNVMSLYVACGHMLAGSVSVGISDEPATEPALSRGEVFDEEFLDDGIWGK